MQRHQSRLASLAIALCTAQTCYMETVIDDRQTPAREKSPPASSSVGLPTSMLVASSEGIARPLMPLSLARGATSVNSTSPTDLRRGDNVQIRKAHQAIARRLHEPAASMAES